jgi:hypothetical protein
LSNEFALIAAWKPVFVPGDWLFIGDGDALLKIVGDADFAVGEVVTIFGVKLDIMFEAPTWALLAIFRSTGGV